MATYIVTYDLRAPNRNYEALYEAIKKYRGWAHINESVWAVVSEQSAVHVRDSLMRFMDQNDSIFVVKSGTEAAWRGVLCKNEWLKENL